MYVKLLRNINQNCLAGHVVRVPQAAGTAWIEKGWAVRHWDEQRVREAAAVDANGTPTSKVHRKRRGRRRR